MNFLKEVGAKAKSATGLDKDEKALESEKEAHQDTKNQLQAFQRELEHTKQTLAKTQLELSKERAKRQELEAQLKAIEDEKNAAAAGQAAAQQEAARKAMEAMQIQEAAKKQALEDSTALYSAMDSFIVDDKKIIQILSSRSNAELQILRNTFMANFGKELDKQLSKKLAGSLRQFALALILPVVEYKCQLIHDAVSGLTTDDSMLVEILCCQTNAELNEMKTTYKAMYDKDLSEVIDKNTSGDLKKLMTIIMLAQRDTSANVNQDQVAADVKALYAAGEDKLMGVDTVPFIQVLGNRSPAHLAALNDAYTGVNKKHNNLYVVLDKLFGGALKKAFQAIVFGLTKRGGYFSEALHDAMEGLGCDEAKVIRIVVYARPEFAAVTEFFNAAHKEPLASRFSSELSGSLKRGVLQCVNMPVDWN